VHVYDFGLDSAKNISPVFGEQRDARKERMPMTNQKLRFDFDLGGHWLSIGDQVSVWRL
jgi:hypothetical protein